MSAGLILTLVVVAAYLAAHVVSQWLARRFLIVSGAEYLLLGVLLGPQVLGAMSASTVGDFAPFMTLALGWIGAVVGAQFYLPDLVRISGALFRVALIEATVTLAVVTVAVGAVIVVVFDLPIADAALPAVALGAIATTSAPAGVAMISRRARQSIPLLRQLEVATAVDAFVAIAAFGILLSVFHVQAAVSPRAPTATEWAVISVGIGVVGGLLFHLFLGTERETDRLFIALAGALILVSGAAAYLRLSPLLPAMLVGIVLINTSDRDALRHVLSRVERPLYFVLLIFAGAAWEPGRYGWPIPVAVFLLARLASKTLGARFAAWAGEGLPGLGKGWGLGLLGHGGLAVAIALGYRLDEDAVLANMVYTAAIVSVLLTDVVSARLVQTVSRGYAERVRQIARRLGAQGPGEGA